MREAIGGTSSGAAATGIREKGWCKCNAAAGYGHSGAVAGDESLDLMLYQAEMTAIGKAEQQLGRSVSPEEQEAIREVVGTGLVVGEPEEDVGPDDGPQQETDRGMDSQMQGSGS